MKHLFLATLLMAERSGNLRGWDLTYHQRNQYEVKLDSVTKRQGKYSVSLTSNDKTDNGAIVYTIPKTFSGRRIILIGHVKTEKVSVKVDKIVQPTIQGIKENLDEVLEPATIATMAPFLPFAALLVRIV